MLCLFPEMELSPNLMVANWSVRYTPVPHPSGTRNRDSEECHVQDVPQGSHYPARRPIHSLSDSSSQKRRIKRQEENDPRHTHVRQKTKRRSPIRLAAVRTAGKSAGASKTVTDDDANQVSTTSQSKTAAQLANEPAPTAAPETRRVPIEKDAGCC